MAAETPKSRREQIQDHLGSPLSYDAGVEATQPDELPTKNYVDTHGGTTDHAALANLDFATAGHTGFSPATHTHALDALSDVDVPAPALGQHLEFTGTQWEAKDQMSAAGPAYTYFLDDTPSGIGAYNTLLRYPTGAAEDIDTATVNSGTGEVLIEGYISDELGRTAIEGGVWGFHTFCKVNSAAGVTQIVVRVYKRTAAGVETELFNVSSGELNNTSVLEVDIQTVQPGFGGLLVTDRLLIRYYATTTNIPDVVVSLYHNGTAHYTHVETPLSGLHVDLAGRSTSGSHPASAISNTPAGGIAATDVQAALNELDVDKAAVVHTHDAGDVTSGTLDGDRLPAMDAAKRGGVPATGAPSGKYLKDDGTWDSPAGGSTPVVVLTLALNEETDQVAPVVVGGMAINPGTWAGATFTFRAIAGGDIDGRSGKVQLWDLTDGDLKHELVFTTAAPALASNAVVLDAALHLYEIRIYTDAGWLYLTSAWLEVSP